MTAPQPPVLVADVGGTNTRVALAHGGSVDRTSIRRLRNAEFPRLEDALRRYLDVAAPPGGIGGACVALAGPVRNGAARMTNLGWALTLDDLARATGAPPGRVALLNDLQAQGQALDQIARDNLIPLRHGQPDRGGARLVIGFGTGVNAAPVQPLPGGGRLVPAAEAGHIHLPIADDEDAALALWLWGEQGFASAEDVLAGSGLERLYRFHARRAGVEDRLPAAQIMEQIAEGAPLAQATGRHYIRLMARYAAALALVHLPFGGIAFIGGVARAMAPYADPFGFDAAFCQMGRFSEFVADFAVDVVTDDYAALTGCAQYLSTPVRA